MNKEEFYHIGRGNLNLNGKFYYGLNYEITDFMRKIEQENINLKQALNEIRNFSKLNLSLAEDNKQDSVPKYVIKDILKIIDKVLGDENNE